MFSLKDTIRRTIIAVSLAGLTTSFFTGCSNNTPVTSNDLYPSTAEVTLETTDDINPGNKDTTHDSNTFSIKYKYWYDNPDVQKAQEETLAQNDPGGDNPDGSTFLGLAGLPLYTDPSGNQYIISGRTIVYLNNGKVTEAEINLLRDNNGNKIYAVENGVEAVADKITVPEGQATTLDDRKQNSGSPEVSADMAIHINNLKTELTTKNSKISLAGIFSICPNIGSFDPTQSGTESKFVATLYTAAGLVDVTFKYDDSNAKVTYSTGLKGTEISVDEDYIIGDSDLLLSAECVEELLGYDIETYDGYINIVTDNHDLFSSTNVIDKYDADKATDKSVITKTADVDPENPVPISKPAPKSEETEPVEETKPATTKKSSDGKYDMTDADTENKNGTFVQNKDKDFEGPDCIADRFGDGYLGSSDTTNPSKIPYSQITIDNAAEAFPYLGWIGYEPDYIEIRPGDSKQIIENKICANYLGTEADTFFNNGCAVDQMEAPEHIYKSEAEYNQALADWKAEQQRLLEADKRHEENMKDPNHRIGDDLKNASHDDLVDLFGR